MPATYQELLTETLPAIIENDEEYGEIHSRLGRLIGKGRSRTPEETKLMRLLGLLVQDYDARHGMPREESTAEDRLQFLLEHSGKTSADLLPVFGQRSHVHEALTGKRPISAAQARKLGEMFSMNANLFL